MNMNGQKKRDNILFQKKKPSKKLKRSLDNCLIGIKRRTIPSTNQNLNPIRIITNKKGKNMKEKIIEKLKKIETLIGQYGEERLVKKSVDSAKAESEIMSAEKLQKQIEDIADENRLLNIGIIGRVKAGKSSLLNSVFFDGKPVLPKAATPMTASLTAMTWGEKNGIKVEYYTVADIDDIKKTHDGYERDLEDKIKDHEEKFRKDGDSNDSEIKKKAQWSAKEDMKNNMEASAAYDQYERMEKSGLLSDMRSKAKPEETIAFDSPDELINKLANYVGEKGEKMPFTRNVTIYMPKDSLKDIQVVDTPGFNDPVVSRVKRTKEYLRECDVIFIVSPAGRFLDVEDKKLIGKASSGEGVRQFYCVASQADLQLHGDILEKTGGNLDNAWDDIHHQLSDYMKNKVLSGMKKDYPEMKDLFDQLIDESKERLIITSSICHDIKLIYEDEDNWDDNMKWVWNNLLKENYPDYFDNRHIAATSLEKLSAIEKVKEKIAQAQSKKDEIILKKQEDYLSGQDKKIVDFIKRLKENIEDDIKDVNDADAEKIKKNEEEIKKLEKDESLFEEADEMFDDSLKDFLKNYKDKIEEAVGKCTLEFFKELEKHIGNKFITKIKEKKGAFAWIARKLWGGGTETTTRKVKTIQVGAVENLIYGYQNLLELLPSKLGFEEGIKEWRDRVYKKLSVEFLPNIKTAEINMRQLKAAFKNIVANTKLSDIDMSAFQPFSYRASGKLEGDSEIEDFKHTVKGHIEECERFYDKALRTFIAGIEAAIKQERYKTYTWTDVKERIENLKIAIGQKPVTIETLKAFQTALGGI
jgi:predicted GTPase